MYKKLTKKLKDQVHGQFIEGFKDYQEYFDNPDFANDKAFEAALKICKKNGENVDNNKYDPDRSAICLYLLDELWASMKDEMDEMAS